MKKREKLFLQFGFHINQQVPADQNIKFGKGRVHDHILGCKDHRFPDLPRYPVSMVVAFKESPKPVRRNVHCDVQGKDSCTGSFDGIFIEVGCKYLKPEISGWLNRINRLLENNCQGICLLTGRATNHPCPQNTSGRPGCQK